MINTKLKILGLLAASVLWAGQAVALPMMYDVNDRATNNTQAGWMAANLNNLNGVTFTGVGGVVLDDRDRDGANTNGGGDISNNDMWRDFIFADERGVQVANSAGIDIGISGLAANTYYDVRLWAFDDVSNGGRNMTWNGVALHIPDGPDPVSLNAQLASFQAMSDGLGKLVLEGRIGALQGDCCNVFVNGFELTASVPEPSVISLLGLGLLGLGFARRQKEV